MPRRRPSAQTARAPARAPAFDLDRHLFFWITQLLARRDRHLAAAVRPSGLRVPEWRVLASLASRHHSTMNELADLASIDRTTLSRTIERMVRAGAVVRLADAADMRVTRLALTAKGERLFAEVLPAVERLNAAALADLPPGAVDLLRFSLAQMCTNLDRANDASAQVRTA